MTSTITIIKMGNDPKDPANAFYITLDGHKWLFALDRISTRNKLRARFLTGAKSQRRRAKSQRLLVAMICQSLDPRQRMDFVVFFLSCHPSWIRLLVSMWTHAAAKTLEVGNGVRR